MTVRETGQLELLEENLLLRARIAELEAATRCSHGPEALAGIPMCPEPSTPETILGLIRNLPGFIYRCANDRAWTMVFISEGCRTITGYAPEDFLYNRTLAYNDIVHPDYQELLWQKWQDLLARRETFEEEYPIVTASKEIRWVWERGRGIFSEAGLLLYLEGFITDITDRKRAEATLRESEQKFRLLHEAAGVGIGYYSKDGIVISYNAIAARNMGGKPEDFIGKALFDLFPRADADLYYGRIQTATIANKPQEYIDKVTLPAGEVWFHSVFARVTDSTGRVIGIQITSTDITVRKKAEESLLRERERLAGILRGTNAGTWEWNVQTGETVFNDRWAEIIGYTLDEISPPTIDTWIKFCHPDDLVVSNQLLQKHFRGALAYYECETRMRHKNGDWVWVLDRGQVAEWTENGKPLWMFGTHQDISERKRADEALRESDIQLKKLSFHVPGMIYQFARRPDGTYHVPFTSEAVGRIFGCSPQDIRDDFSPIANVILNEDLDRVVRSIEDSAEHLTPWQCEYRVQINGQPVKWLYGQATPEKFADGRIVWHGFNTDITERKQAEEQRFEMERRLQHAQRLESLGVLTGGIAHDFNNLLQIILGKASFAKEACMDNQDALNLLSDIDVVVKRASTLIKQMLAYAGKGKYRAEPIDLYSLCTETSQLMKASISKKANLYFELTPDLKIEADISQLTQVLMNLITNASESIGDNEGDIRIRTNIVQLDGPNAREFSPSDQLPAGSYARIEVSDTGCGMDEVTLVKIFDPFFTTKFAGRGLGLSAVQGIVRSHKGALRVESQPGKGTTFTILVPVSEGIPKAEARGAPAATPQMGFRGTVLVVDDEEKVRGLLKRRLERLGVRVMEAENGQEALDIYRQHDKEISLVLLDYKMPKLDGIETFIELKKLNPDVKAILSSGYGEEDAIKGHGPRGWSGFIQKPYDMEEMVAKVQSLLNEGPTDYQAR